MNLPQIEQLLAEPGTIGVGYNTIRFDDEVTPPPVLAQPDRPHARSGNECGRWDLTWCAWPTPCDRKALSGRALECYNPTDPTATPASSSKTLARANGLPAIRTTR
jgi:exodeoxyribonuclease-1